MSCKVSLFLPNQTSQGILRNVKTPVIKYPYLSLSQQLISVLKIPHIKALLDSWRIKPCKSGKYSDIFDGDMCRVHLKVPNGTLFFSNLPHERQGPGGELQIGVNLGVDWYVLSSPCIVLRLTHFVTGSLTYTVTSPHLTPRALRPFQYAISHLNIGESLLHNNITPHLIVQILYIKSHVHEHSSRSKRTEPQQDPTILTSHHIRPTSPLERWHQSPDRVKARR